MTNLKKSKHIIFVVKDLGSFLSHRMDLANFLVGQGMKVSLVTDMQDVRDFEGQAIINHVQDLPFSSAKLAPWKLIFPSMSFFKLLAQNRNATVFSVTLPAVLMSGLFCKILRMRQVILFAGLGNVFHGEPSFFRRLLKFVLSKVTKKNRTEIIAHNKDVKRFLIENDYAKTVNVILGSGISSTELSPPPGKRINTPPKILFLGRMLKEKGVLEFIAAAKLTLDAGHMAKFILAGRTDPLNPTSLSEPEILALLGEHAHIRWIGASKNVRDLLASIDIVCLPSYHEGLPRSLLEGALMGCCLVATNIPGSSDIVIPGKTGVLADARSPESLSAGFIELLKNPTRIQELAFEARKHVLKSFTNETILPMYFKIINEC